MMLHNSTSSSNWSVDMIVSISLSLALSSRCLCNYMFLEFLLLFFLCLFQSQFHEIDPLYNDDDNESEFV